MLLVNKSGEEYNLKLNEDELCGNKDTLYLLAEQTGFEGLKQIKDSKLMIESYDVIIFWNEFKHFEDQINKVTAYEEETLERYKNISSANELTKQQKQKCRELGVQYGVLRFNRNNLHDEQFYTDKGFHKLKLPNGHLGVVMHFGDIDVCYDGITDDAFQHNAGEYWTADSYWALDSNHIFGDDDVESKHNCKIWKAAAKKAYEELSR